MRSYLAWERGGVGRWADTADVEFAPDDIVRPFENDCGEPMAFWQRRGAPFAVLLHHELDWEPVRMQEPMLRLDLIPSIGDVILDAAQTVPVGRADEEVQAGPGSACWRRYGEVA
ncbi:hypothetical protein ABT143_09345 [Streptomyces sp. NPDC002033]|uniref:hypothetical protein n=1 Tax=unclassified Streptomyces TaxID=2593676 RepID=UPI00331AAE29